MPKVVNPSIRLSEFPNTGLISKNGKLYCNYCAEFLQLKKSTVESHVKSIGHMKNERSKKTQPTIVVAVQTQEESKSIWTAGASAFVSAGIPLHALQNSQLQQWLKSNLKIDGDIPSDRSLRRYLEREAEVDLAFTKEVCSGKDVILIIDETQDFKTRKIINVLISPAEINPKFRLLSTTTVERCNAEAILQTILNSLQSIVIPINKVIALVTDNAQYMVSAGKTLVQLNSRAIHSTCFAHIVHLVAEEIRSSMETADLFISKVKACLVKAHSRRDNLYMALENHGKARKLPPSPVLTRWTTWLEAGDYHYKNIDALREWILNSDPDSEAMKKLKSLIDDSELHSQLESISTVYLSLSTTLKKLESNNVLATEVLLLLETLGRILELSPYFEKGLSKLQLYLNGKHPSIAFWREVQYFDPRMLNKFNANDLPPSIVRMQSSPIGLDEIMKYKSIVSDYVFDEKFEMINFWKGRSRDLPGLFDFFKKLISIPPSSAEVERSFSALNRLLKPNRSSLTIENLGIHLRIQFNNRNVSKEQHEIDVEMSSDEEQD